MRKVHDWFLPDYDQHYEEWMKINNEVTYQRLQREYALHQVKNFHTAIDIGGNIGFWSRDFCDRFENVVIFEPDASNIECLETNLSGKENYDLHRVGLGSKQETKTFYKSLTTSGAHSFFRDQVFEDRVEESRLEIKRLDDYEIQNVGLIKIDTQGSEYDILMGGLETLKKNNAVLNIEIEHKSKDQKIQGEKIVALLNSIGYKEYGRSRKKEVVFTKR